jgi:hypothetical protein
MTATLTATRTNDQVATQSPFDTELVSAIRDNKLVQIPWKELKEKEKQVKHVIMFHNISW